MMFKSDSQRRACFANLFSEDRDKLLARGKDAKGYMNCRLFTQTVSGTPDLESLPKVKLKDIEPSDILVYGSPKYPMHYAVYLGDDEVMEVPEWGKEMVVNKVEQEIGKPFRAYRWKTGDNKFALYIDHDSQKNEDYIRSDKYPEVNVCFETEGAKKDASFEQVKNIPEQDLIGLKTVQFFTKKGFKKTYPTLGVNNMYIAPRDDKPDEIRPAIAVLTSGGKDQTKYDLHHEMGHHVHIEHSRDDVNSNPFIEEQKADSYVKRNLGGVNKKGLNRTSDWSDDATDFNIALAEKKALSFDKAMEYAGVKDEI